MAAAERKKLPMKRVLRTLVRWLQTAWTFFRCGAGVGRIASVAAHVEQTLHDAGQHRLSAPLARLRPSLLDTRLSVAVFGEFNRGKSTLLNALLGRDILPAKLVPTTGQTIRLVEGTEEEVRVYFRDGGISRSPVQEFDRITSLGINGRVRDDIASVEVVVTAPLLRGGLVLLDTPGCNEGEKQTSRACHAVAEADLVLFVLDAQKLLSEAERRTASWLIDKLGKPMVAIVNFMNRLEEADRQQARRRLEQWCRDRVLEELERPWFEINALGALKHALGSSPSPVDDFWALQRALLRLQGRKRRHLQQRSRRCRLLAVLKTLEHAHAKTVRSLQEQVQRSKQERESLFQTLRTSRRRWEADARTHRQRLLASAERTLEDSLQAFEKQFAGKSRAVLEQAAGSWYEEALLRAIATLERQANTTLTMLATAADCSLEPVALAGAIDTNFQITPLSSLPRDVLGNSIGDFMEEWFGVGPNYAAVYGEQARQKWAEAAQCVPAALRRQYDHACGRLQEHWDHRVRTCRRQDPQLAAKLRRQEDAQAVLKRAREQLSSC
jgi:tRNA U34 5-carboxymethylaminomethyl modifying GTPase MnmE/TrmE